MNDRATHRPSMPNSALIKAKHRPSAPPPPPPPPNPKRVMQQQQPRPGESRRTSASTPSSNTLTSATAAASSTTDAYQGRQQHALRRPGANNRCNGGSVLYQPQARPIPHTTYEVYHINQALGIPTVANPPPAHHRLLRAQPPSSYCYIPHSTHSSAGSCSKSTAIADLSQGSCDNAPATPDSLDSLVGSGEDEEDKSDDACSSSDRLQCTSSVLSPLSTADDSVDNNVTLLAADNNNTIKRSPRPPGSSQQQQPKPILSCRNGNQDQRDNLIEELTTLIARPYEEEQTPSPRVSSSSSASSSPDNNNQMSSNSSRSSSSRGSNGAMSSSLTPSTVVAPHVTESQASFSSSNVTSTLVGETSSSTPIVRSEASRSHYYFEGDNKDNAAAATGEMSRAYARQNPTAEHGVYEQLTSTMLRRSRSQQLNQGQHQHPRSVGNTPPLPAKHVMNSHYMPLQAYCSDYRYYHDANTAAPSGRLRRSNPQIHYATELVLTPHQAQQIQQSLVNRYATIGRNYHINVGSDQTAVKADVHHRPMQPPAPPQQPKAYHRSNDNLAMRINNNLISHPNLVMNEKQQQQHLEAPLTDVRRLNEVTTPPTLSMTSKRNHAPMSSSEDILSAESTTECCDEDGRLSPDEEVEPEEYHPRRRPPQEEEDVRKHTLLSTLVMPRPQRKPPFTIEGAMSKLLGRTKKEAKEADASTADAAGSQKMVTNGQRRRRKASPAPPPPRQQKQKQAVVSNGPSDLTADEEASSGVLDNNSLVTTLRRAGSDREPSNLKTSDEEMQPPESDCSTSGMVKKMKKVIGVVHNGWDLQSCRHTSCATENARRKL